MGSRTLGAETAVSKLRDRLSNLEEQIQNQSQSQGAQTWKELTQFQTELYRAMALDPGPGSVSPHLVPKHLFAQELNTSLQKNFDHLRKSTVPKEARAQYEWEQYQNLIEKVLSLRAMRKFPEARAFAKRGQIDIAYFALNKKVSQSTSVNLGAQEALLSEVKAASDLVTEISKTQNSAPVFSSGRPFMISTLFCIFGFLIGLFAFRYSPKEFQKFLEKTLSPARTATTNNPTGANPLDYARWLKDFEEILSRLKAAQLSHERRIEEVTLVSEKMAQQALSLYSDARIKNEANLEYRMSSLLREIQHQNEQCSKLKTGERAQYQRILEHSLHLCDAIERNALKLSQDESQSA